MLPPTLHPKLDTFFLVYLCQNLVDIQNGYTNEWICPCCVSCLAKQSGDVKNDDVTSGSMVTALDRKELKGKITCQVVQQSTEKIKELATVALQSKNPTIM